MKAIQLGEQFVRDIERMQPEVISLIKALCAIPAPSHHEEKRAAFIRDWFAQRGMPAEIDDALNVLCPMGLEEHEDMVVVMAHTDTVFPDMEPFDVIYDGDVIRCLWLKKRENCTARASAMIQPMWLL